ncbi:MAG: hypothetical protein ACOC1K_03815 [Nanoarchaeota archaeon]
MKEDQSEVFLYRIRSKIYAGEFDKYISIPFISKELIYSSIKGRVNLKLQTGGTPLLSDKEIKDAVSDAIETALITAKLFLEIGILKKENGVYSVTEKGMKAILSQ